jgi:uncharacterized repeat protein (TIGR01451 family)
VPVPYYPISQTLYTWSSGTSHSTPAVAGAASLIYEYYGRLMSEGETPSPAMLKALMLNTPRYLNGVGTGGTLPSPNQGWGDVDLGQVFDGLPRAMIDQWHLFDATGDLFATTGTVYSSTRPFHVTVVWTDAPGPTTGNAYVNDLNLEVTVGGVTYKGNVFSGAFSTSGGVADARNNVESVFVPAGITGTFQVKVVAANLPGDGVPGNADATDQDFALLIYNGTVSPQVWLDQSGLAVSDALGDDDGVVEPGDTITLAIGLENSGTMTAAGLSATLDVLTGTATLTNSVSAYPDLDPSTTATNTTAYLGAVSPLHPCGLPLSFALTATYNITESAIFNFEVPMGRQLTYNYQNFDSVAAPGLPSGWAATVLQGNPTPWQTVAGSVQSGPNAAFAPGVSAVSDNALVSPVFVVASANAQLSFRNNYNLEPGFDGTVLEIKLGAGAFTDILTAGGSFAAGGYNRTLSNSFSNPLGGRLAWSGNSGGYITTTINLPASALGQTVQLRWRLGTDNTQAYVGQSIDTLTLRNAYTCRDPIPTYLPLILR